MLSSAKQSDVDLFMALPGEIGGRETQAVYVVVSDPDAVYSRAKSAGAEILLDIKDEDYGGRGFTCRAIHRATIWISGCDDPWPSS